MKVEMSKQYRSSAEDGLFDGIAFSKVHLIDLPGKYPVVISLKNETILSFTSDGFYWSDKRECSYNLREVEPFGEFKLDDKVMVRNYKEGVWYKRYYLGSENGKTLCFAHGSTSWSKTDDDFMSGWNFCRRPTEAELKGE